MKARIIILSRNKEVEENKKDDCDVNRWSIPLHRLIDVAFISS